MAEFRITWHNIVHPSGVACLVCQEGRYPRAGKWPVLQVYKAHDADRPYATASVNLNTPCAPDEVAIKDYSENEGMLDALVQAGVVNTPHRFIDSGYVRIPVCRFGSGA